MTLHGDQRALAIGFAHAAHHGQYDRDGELHIRHVQRVVIGVNRRRTEPEAYGGRSYYTFARLGGVADEVQAVAWLHDVIEDTHVEPEYLRSAGFSPLVIEAVRLLTRPQDGTSYLDYVAAIADAETIGPAAEMARMVKQADLADNLARSIEEGNPGIIRRYGTAMALITGAIERREEQP